MQERQSVPPLLAVDREASDERAAIELFLASRRALVERLGPSEPGKGTCGATYTTEHLREALRDGHCQLGAYWTKDKGEVALDVDPTDEMITGPFSYPVEHWSVKVAFTSPLHVKTMQELPPADLLPTQSPH